MDGRIRVKFRFWHALANTVKDNQKIVTGSYIQASDSTGASSGDHVHWSMKFVDRNGATLDRDNGYYGAVDFSSWYVNEYIMNQLGTKKKPMTYSEYVKWLVFEMKMFIANFNKKNNEETT